MADGRMDGGQIEDARGDGSLWRIPRRETDERIAGRSEKKRAGLRSICDEPAGERASTWRGFTMARA